MTVPEKENIRIFFCKGHLKVVKTGATGQFYRLKKKKVRPTNKLYLFFIVYVIDYAITVVPIFPPFPSSTQHPHSLRQSLHHCARPWVMCVSSLAAPFPTLYSTSPWLFVTICLYFLIPSFITHSLTPRHIWQPSKHSLYP